ncbi:DUF4221 domain-containing protein [Belliella sp. DSM 111904]|uniref:DUF4221 domain-containing protein n=1 Tax=Belliella filtrata TaxID=2923435 RepID=A0ABS9V5E3_9BACT|nr:DUF4221 family protein [Belliella filtrata]MCH7411642.1 DUF4221 domain-containing protein [Belliella filtrata]
MNLLKVLSVFIMLSSCKPKINNIEFTWSHEGEVVFQASNMAYTNPGMIQYIDTDSGEFIFYYNHIAKNLQFTEFPSGKNILDIPLEFEDEKRTRNFTGATLFSKDTIGVTFFPPAIGIIDFSGELNMFEPLIEKSFNVSHIGSGGYIPLIKEGIEIFGAQPFLMGHHQMKESDIQKQHLLYTFNLETDRFYWQDVFYKKHYWEEGKKQSYFSWARKENKIYIAPFYDHEIQVFDLISKKVILKKECKSEFINQFYMVDVFPGSTEEATLKTIGSDQYDIFLYDNYRDVFYRILLPGYTPKNRHSIDELQMLERSRPKTGVMVLDNDLNSLGEYVFDDFEVHSSANFFVGREGLYVSTNNLNSDDFSDDNFKYRVLKIDKNQQK